MPAHPSSFSPEHLEDYLSKMFSIADANGDGVLQPDELRRMLRLCNFALSEQEITEFVNAADTNHDGLVDYDEFVPVATKMLHHGSFVQQASSFTEASHSAIPAPYSNADPYAGAFLQEQPPAESTLAIHSDPFSTLQMLARPAASGRRIVEVTGRGNALVRNGEYDAAIEAFEVAISLDGRCTHAHNGVGTALWHKGQYRAALEAYDRSLQTNPTNADAQHGRVNVLRSMEAAGIGKRAQYAHSQFGRYNDQAQIYAY